MLTIQRWFDLAARASTAEVLQPDAARVVLVGEGWAEIDRDRGGGSAVAGGE